jgi:hypothetical protein
MQHLSFFLIEYYTLKFEVIGYGVLRHFQQYFNYIVHVAVNFMGGGNLSTRRKPPTCRKSLTNFIT